MSTRKALRSERIDYEKGGLFYVTVCCRERRARLNFPEARDEVVAAIKSISGGAPAWVYCYAVLPDHFHLLVLTPTGVSLTQTVGLVKGRATRRLRDLGIRSLWQRSFYEHLVRDSEARDSIAQYILDNPVRRGLVERYEDWRWCGILDWLG